LQLQQGTAVSTAQSEGRCNLRHVLPVKILVHINRDVSIALHYALVMYANVEHIAVAEMLLQLVQQQYQWLACTALHQYIYINCDAAALLHNVIGAYKHAAQCSIYKHAAQCSNGHCLWHGCV
jgi:hypothetical protein